MNNRLTGPAKRAPLRDCRFPQRLSPLPPSSGPMTGKAHRREVRCAKCGFWWHHPKEPLHFASWDEWAEEHQERETLACPNCGERTEVSEGTTRFTETGEAKVAKPGKKQG